MVPSAPSAAPSTTVDLVAQHAEALRQTVAFRRLTGQQQQFVLALISNGGDTIAACRVAYPKAKPESQVVMSYSVSQNPAVQDALEVYRWMDSRAALIELCKANLRACEPGSTAAQRLVTQLERLMFGITGSNRGRFIDPDAIHEEPEVEEPVTPAQTFVVGQRVTQRDDAGVVHIGQVMEIDADGKPSKIEEIL